MFRVRRGIHYGYTLCLILLSYCLPAIKQIRRNASDSFQRQNWSSDIGQPNPPLFPTNACIARSEDELITAFYFMLYSMVCVIRNPVFCFHLLVTGGTGLSILTSLPLPVVPPLACMGSLSLFYFSLSKNTFN